VPTFDEQLDSAMEANTIQFLQSGLEEADKRIRSANEQVQAIQAQQLEFRDEIAVRAFVPLIDKLDNYDQAAISAYQAADAFLRARETGMMLVVTEVPEDKLDN
jgi:hypothetical protein